MGNELPFFQVFRLDAAVEQYLMSVPSKPEAEVDVLDRGHGEFFTVKAAVRNEYLTAYGAEARPKRGRVAPRVLVDKMVLQIFVLR